MSGPTPHISSFRAASPLRDRELQFGPLAELPGNWHGTGFNLIARPNFQNGDDIFLELNLTTETLRFNTIGGAIPNRGSFQNDMEIFGLHYLQQISDSTTKGAIHIEPGIWLNVPATTAPPDRASVVRLATIPHGNALLAQGEAFTVHGPPQFEPANTVPFNVGDPTPAPGTPNPFEEYNLAVPNPSRTDPSPVPQSAVTDPNSVLAAAIAGQTIVNTEVLVIGTTGASSSSAFGGVENIPFVVQNANVPQVTATFWIETVERPHGHGHFLQLQYTQTVLLNFPKFPPSPTAQVISWPHVSVATLVKTL